MMFHQTADTKSGGNSLQHASCALDIVLRELCQLVLSFTYCYENEMQPWCHQSQPDFLQLGPAFKRVYNLLQQFAQVIHSMYRFTTKNYIMEIAVLRWQKMVDFHLRTSLEIKMPCGTFCMTRQEPRKTKFLIVIVYFLLLGNGNSKFNRNLNLKKIFFFIEIAVCLGGVLFHQQFVS